MYNLLNHLAPHPPLARGGHSNMRVLRAATGVTICDRPKTASDRAAKLPVTL